MAFFHIMVQVIKFFKTYLMEVNIFNVHCIQIVWKIKYTLSPDVREGPVEISSVIMNFEVRLPEPVLTC